MKMFERRDPNVPNIEERIFGILLLVGLLASCGALVGSDGMALLFRAYLFALTGVDIAK